MRQPRSAPRTPAGTRCCSRPARHTRTRRHTGYRRFFARVRARWAWARVYHSRISQTCPAYKVRLPQLLLFLLESHKNSSTLISSVMQTARVLATCGRLPKRLGAIDTEPSATIAGGSGCLQAWRRTGVAILFGYHLFASFPHSRKDPLCPAWQPSMFLSSWKKVLYLQTTSGLLRSTFRSQFLPANGLI